MKIFLLTILCVLTLGCKGKPEGIFIEQIGSNKIHYKLITNPKNLDRPMVVVVPGSGGSYMPDKYLFGLVQSGYDVLSIAYVGKRGLPKKIEQVPLEYLKKILLVEKARFPDRKIVLLGISKGAEYVLTFASKFNLVDGIICYSPSSFVLPNHVGLKKNEIQKSSWTLNGKEIPFAELAYFSDKAGRVTYNKYITPIFDDIAKLDKSTIRVENITCNLLLLSGEDDMVWPSTRMASLIQSKINESNSNINVIHKSYKDCGHQFVWFNKEKPTYVPEYQSMNLTGIKKHKFLFGGNKEATIRAMVESKNTVITFLNNIETTHNSVFK